MKKILCFIIVTAVFLSLFSIFPYASEDNLVDIIEEKSFDENAVYFSCKYNYSENNVVIDGTVNHDVLINNGDYTIEVFLLYHGQSQKSITDNPDIQPLASAKMAIKFKFVIPVDNNYKRFSKYAIVFTSPEGERYVIGAPQFPEVYSGYDYDKYDRKAFKGGENIFSSDIGNSEIGTSVISLDLSKMFGDSNDGYLYPFGNGGYTYIKKSYIDDLDKKIFDASIYGGEVYLRYLLPYISNESTVYSMPDVSSEDTLEYIIAFSSFLAERYSSYEKGNITGIILGKSVDVRDYNCVNSISRDSYVELVLKYLITVGNTVRNVTPELDIVLPVSDLNDYYSPEKETDEITPSFIIKKITESLDEGFRDGFDFSLMVETTAVSDYVSEKILKNNTSSEKEKITPDNVYELTRYVDALNESYDSAPNKIIYQWTVPTELSSNELSSAYAYSYYKLLSNTDIASFVVSFENNSDFKDVKHIYEFIDTHLSFEVTKNVLGLFGEDSWGKVIGTMYSGDFSLRNLHNVSAEEGIPEKYTGSFVYYNSDNSKDWYAGDNCTSVREGYSSLGERSVNAIMQIKNHGEYAGLYLNPKYSENMSYTPQILFKMSIGGDNIPDNALFEISIKLGSKGSSAIVTETVQIKEKALICADFGDFVNEELTDYIKISVRPITDSVTDFTLSIYEVVGYSDFYSSNDLSSMINEERESLRGNTEPQKNVSDNGEFVLIVMGVTLVIVLLGFGGILITRRNEDDPEKED